MCIPHVSQLHCTKERLWKVHVMYVCEAQQQVMVVGKVIFLLVSPHTEIMGVTQNNFYQLHYRMNE